MVVDMTDLILGVAGGILLANLITNSIVFLLDYPWTPHRQEPYTRKLTEEELDALAPFPVSRVFWGMLIFIVVGAVILRNL